MKAPLQSKHVRRAGPRRSTEEIKRLRAQMKIPATMEDLRKQEQDEKAAIDGATVDEPQFNPRDTVPALQGAPAPPLQMPWGRDRDAFLAEQNELDMADRVLADIAENLDVSDEARRIYKLLLARSQPRKRGDGWRTVDLGRCGADVYLVLGLAPPVEHFAYPWNLTDRPMPQVTAEQRLEASRVMDRATEELRRHGLLRSVGLFTEISLSAV
jgi:hypothetical protein